MSGRSPLRPTPEGSHEGGGRSRPSADIAAGVAADAKARLERDAADRDRRHRARVIAGAAVTAVVALFAGVVAARFSVDEDHPAEAPGVGRAFDALGSGDTGLPGAIDAAFSPEGARLVVKRGGGALGVAEGGRFRPIVPDGTHVAAYAWLGTSSVLVQEGPVSTGRLAVIDIDGTDRGGIALDPAVPPGGAMAVSPSGAMAALNSFGDPEFAGQATPVDLWIVELASGRARRLTMTPRAIETDVQFLDEGTVAVVVRSDGGAELVTIDVASGETRRIAAVRADTRILAVQTVNGREELVWNEGTAIHAGGAQGAARRLGSVPAGTTPVTMDPSGRRAIVRELSDDGADSQLRVVDI